MGSASRSLVELEEMQEAPVLSKQVEGGVFHVPFRPASLDSIGNFPTPCRLLSPHRGLQRHLSLLLPYRWQTSTGPCLHFLCTQKVGPVVFLSFGKRVSLAGSFVIFLFLSEDFEKWGLLQIRQGIFPLFVNPCQQNLFFRRSG